MNEWVQFIEGFHIGDFEDPERTAQYVDFFSFEALLQHVPDSGAMAVEADPRRLNLVDPLNETPFPPEWCDLARLHWILLHREVVNVVEFGSGFSTAIIAHALELNETILSDWVNKHRRHSKPFTLTTVDESSSWLEVAMSRVPGSLVARIYPVSSAVTVGQFGGRVCSFYDNVPELVADLVYIDGPSQYASTHQEGIFDTGKPHLMPMSGDLLPVEHFFEPGAIILLDGRTANARFLEANFQRRWQHECLQMGEAHIFELQEDSLGSINSNRLDRLTEKRKRFLI